MRYAIFHDEVLVTKSHPDVDHQSLKYFFRLLDDDGNVYFHGRSDEEDFEPLDWASDRFGCTEIQYLTNGKWETL